MELDNCMLRTINSCYVDSRKIIAQCHLSAHRGYLSKELVKSHECIAKKCPFLEKLNPEYWQRLEEVEDTNKKKRQKQRAKRKQALLAKNDRDAFIRATLENSGHIHVTAIREEGRKMLAISYIYDKRIDLTPEIQILREKLQKSIRLQARIGSSAVIAQLLRKEQQHE